MYIAPYRQMVECRLIHRMGGNEVRLVISIGLLVLSLAAPGVAQNVLKVPGQYKTIQAAIDAAQRYDTVLVDPGTYVENLVIKKNIWVKSSGGPYLTTIDGGGNDSVVKMDLAKGGIDGFTITNGNAYGVKTRLAGASTDPPGAWSAAFCSRPDALIHRL